MHGKTAASLLFIVPIGVFTASALHDRLHAETPGRVRIALPFACAIDQQTGQLRLQPSAEQIYELADRPESQRHTSCRRAAPGGEERCRTFTVHRFAMLCGEHRVPWIDIAAAALARRPSWRTAVEEGRLVIRQSRLATVDRGARCFHRLRNVQSLQRLYASNVMDDCWQAVGGRRVVAEPVRMAFPSGFAPAGLVGARFLPPERVPRAETSVPVSLSVPTPDAPSPVAPVVVARPDTLSPEIVEAHARLAFAQLPSAGAGLTAPLRQTLSPSLELTSSEDDPPLPSPARLIAPAIETGESAWQSPVVVTVSVLALSALMASLMLAFGPVGWRTGLLGAVPRLKAVRDEAVIARSGGPDDKVIEQLGEIATERLAACRSALEMLPAAMPLRQVIARELRGAVERQEMLSGAASATSPEDARRVRMRMQAVARDLQRLAAIAEGARSSLGGGPLTTAELSEPRDRSEAFAVLGVSPDADARILKKLVEALRQSWHPDQARDATDRRRREHRIKQINVAWDLIQGKRVEA